MCLVNGDAVWIGDNAGYIHAYRVNDYATAAVEIFNTENSEEEDASHSMRGYPLLFSYKMEPDAMEEPSPVRAIHFVPELQRVCVAMHNGRMFLCDASVIPTGMIGGEGSFVMTELGSSSCIHSVSSVIKSPSPLSNAPVLSEDNQSSVEIWLVWLIPKYTYILFFN